MADLKKWFYVIHLFLNGKKEINALWFQREIGATYKTSWCMSFARGNKKKQKDDEDDNDFMNIMVKIDENMKKGSQIMTDEHNAH